MSIKPAQHIGYHLLRAKRLAAADTVERLRPVKYDLGLGLFAQQQARYQTDGILWTGFLAEPALHAVALDEFQFRVCLESSNAFSGQAPTHAMHSVQVLVLTSTRPYGAPG